MPRLSARNTKELRALAKGLGVPMSKLEPGPLPILLASSRFGGRVTPDELREAESVACDCQSPIERMLLWALLGEHEFANFDADTRAVLGELGGPCLRVQRPICGFTADFVIEPGARNPERRTVVIECDGHEWHSDRKRMARDRKRDRDIQKAGHVILRFTGSQIVNDPKACALEVVQFIKG